MDFDNFNFDDILGDFLNENTDETLQKTAESKSEVTLEASEPAEPEYLILEDEAESPEPQTVEKISYEENGEPERETLPGKKNQLQRKDGRRFHQTEENLPDSGRIIRRDSALRSDEKDRVKKEKNAERQAAREAKEAEAKAARRRKVLEKKADQRRIEQQRQAAEYERESAREYLEQERAAKRANDVDGRRRSVIGSIVFIVVLALLITSVVMAAKAIDRNGKTLPNVFVGDIPVGNMTKEQVYQRLVEKGWSERVSTPLTVSSFHDVKIEIDPVQAGAAIPLNDAVEKACIYGRSGNMFATLYKYIECLLKPVDVNDAEKKIDTEYIRSQIDAAQQQVAELVGTEPYTVDLEKGELRAVKGAGNLELEPVGLTNEIISALRNGVTELTYTVVSRDPVMPDFNALHSQLYAEVSDARYTDDGRYDVIEDTVGCDFDPAEAVNIWNTTQLAETAVVPLKVTRPAVTGDELRSRLYNDLLGTMTTYFPNSTDDRINNVNLASSKVNGTILYPGDLFSYNGIVGERTEEAGFKYAAAYSDGEVVEELGGGACQVSSTLYCATLYARLETVERTCHMFEVAYMDQLGLDATVSWPEPDFKFRNNKTYPIKLVAHCDTEAKSLTFEIWGTKEDDYTVELKTDKYQYHSDEGYWVGWRTVTMRYLYDADGNVVPVPGPDGNMVEYEYTYTDENGKPLMDTYLFHNS